MKKVLLSGKEFTETKKDLVHIENSLIDSAGGMYLTVDSLIEINSIITSSNNITLRKVNVKPYRFDKMYMAKELTKDKLCQMIGQFKERKITSTKFYSILLNRSSRLEVFCKKGVLKNFAKFTGKHLCQSLFFNKRPATLLKKRLWHRCFPVNFAKFFRTHFFIEHL